MSVSRDQEPAPSGTAPAQSDERRVAQADRRALTLRTLLASGFSPRRRTGRRAGDHESPVDFHDPRLLVPVVAILLLSVADAFLTVTLINHGADEVNPLLAFVLRAHPRSFALVKVGLTSIGAVVLVMLARARVFKLVRASQFLYGLAALYFALIGYEAWLVGSIG